MTPTRKRRLLSVGFVLVGMIVAAGILISVLGDNINAFRPPAEVVNGSVAEGVPFRLGGMVVEESVSRDPQSLQVSFELADLESKVLVTYDGILPDLFREGQGIVADGRLRSGVFIADRVLAKHDETYMPPELAKTLEEQGLHQSRSP